MDTAELYRLYSHMTVLEVIQHWADKMVCNFPIRVTVNGKAQRAILNGIEREDGSGYCYNLKINVGIEMHDIFVRFPRSMALVKGRKD